MRDSRPCLALLVLAARGLVKQPKDWMVCQAMPLASSISLEILHRLKRNDLETNSAFASKITDVVVSAISRTSCIGVLPSGSAVPNPASVLV